MWDPEEVKIPILRTLYGKIDQECVCMWRGKGVCGIKLIFPSICEVPVWSLDIENISDYPPVIASSTFIGLQGPEKTSSEP